MLDGTITKLFKFITKIKLRFYHKRDQVYIKNILIIFILQVFTSCSSIFILPLSLGFIDQERYGLWLVINSVFAWIGFFNLGLGAGLRLKLTESLAHKNYDLSQKYVSTAFLLVSIIAAVIIITLFAAHHYINWTKLFGAQTIHQSDINNTILLCTIAFTARFILTLILNILAADQKIGLMKIFPLFTNIFIIASLIFIRNYAESSLFSLSIAIIIPEIMVYVIINIILFKKLYRSITPSFNKIYLPLSKDLISIGLKFFIIQISIIILFSTDNIILTRLFAPSSIVPYNIALQYMGYASTLFYLILSPTPYAFTEAHALNDTQWSVIAIKRLIKLWLILLFVLLIFIIVSPYVYKIWIGNDIIIPRSLTILMAIYTASATWNNIFGNYNSGIGKLHLGMIICIIIIIINIPLSIYLARDLGLGPNGVISASIICILLGSIASPIQTYLLLTGKARGIWNK